LIAALEAKTSKFEKSNAAPLRAKAFTSREIPVTADWSTRNVLPTSEIHRPINAHARGISKTPTRMNAICTKRPSGWSTTQPFQNISIIRNRTYGRIHFGWCCPIVRTRRYIYHETLVHPGMLLHDNPERVLIIGARGASLPKSCGTNRETRTMVDIDGELCANAASICRMGRGAFEDPRLL